MPGGGTGRGAIAYLAVASVQRAATLLVLPFFAAALSPQEYGQIATLLVVYGLVMMLCSAGLEAPLFRAMFSQDSKAQQGTYVSTIVTTLFVGPLIVGGLVGFAISMGPSVLGLEPHYLGVYVLIGGILTSATVGPLALLRAKERFGSYALLSLAYAVVQLSLKLWLVVVKDMGVRGWMIADLVAAIFALALSLRWQSPYLAVRKARREDLRSGLRMGLPLVPHLAAHWVLNLSDRLVIAAFWAPAVVGVYSMGYQIGFVAGLGVSELNRAFMPRYGEALEGTAARDMLSAYARRQIVATVALTAGASLLGPQVVHLLLPASYSGAARLIPWVALGFAFVGFYYVPMNLITIVAGDTQGLWLMTVCAAAANLGGNLLLVPHLGPIAAAVNTTLGYLLLLILIGITTYRRCPTLRLDLRPVFGVVPLAMGLAAVGSVLSVRKGEIGLVASIVGVVLVLLVLGLGVRRPQRLVPSPLARDLYA